MMRKRVRLEESAALAPKAALFHEKIGIACSGLLCGLCAHPSGSQVQSASPAQLTLFQWWV